MSEDTPEGPRHGRPDAADDPTPPAGEPAASSGARGPSGTRELPAGDTADTADSADTAAFGEDAEPHRGRVRYQDPATTTPREPTVAELRARREAQRREQAQREAAEAAATRKNKVRKRVLVGGGVAVGVVALVAVIYAASSSGDETTAQCVDQTNHVVPDEQCGGEPNGGYYNNAGVFVPLFIPLGGFGNQYHYNYGSRSPVGTIASGGSVTPPASGTTLRGTSGSSVGTSSSSGTVSRGGLGVSGSGSGSGVKAGGSGSSSGS